MQLDRELAPAATTPSLVRSTVTLNSKKPPPFNASGSLGVVEVASPAPSTSSVPKQATTPAAVGSGLKAGAVVTVVKRKPKEKGRMRVLAAKASKKGKGKAVETESEEEEEESDFDSSDSAMDSSSEEEEEDGDGDESEEEWKGIEDDTIVEPTAATGDEEPVASQEDEEEDDDDDDSESDDDDPSAPSRPPREKGAFQAWAEAQVLSAAGLSSTLPSADPSASSNGEYVPLLPAGSGFHAPADPTGVTGPLGEVLPSSQLPTLPPQRSTHVPILRTEEIKKQRAELPIVKEEDRIMEAIRGNAVIIICGETGSGKTTQVGQFLWEAGWGDKSSGTFGWFTSP